mmetsp:Transcript_30910/g.43890  ORF Transcript_30910/g.43890 Transcript_30910/m.43890 type:complete len:256 (+) Transcript_30910:168-935(+)
MFQLASQIYLASMTANNEGVHAFEAGEFVLAKHFLQLALVQMEGVAASHKLQHEGMLKICPSLTPQPKGTSVIFQWSLSASQCSLSHLPKDEQHRIKDGETTTYVYKKALLMTAHPFTNDETILNFSNELACITYNLALTNHLLGNSLSDEVQQRQALALYEEAFEYFNQAMELRSREAPQSDINVFGMAVSCNVGQLYYDVFADYDKARINFANLSTWVNALKLRPIGRIMDADSIQGFVFNSFLLKPNLAAAA